MANKEDVMEWYADLAWASGFIDTVLERYELDEELLDMLQFCQKKMKLVHMNMLKKGLRNVSQQRIISKVSSRAPQPFGFTYERERPGTGGSGSGDQEPTG